MFKNAASKKICYLTAGFLFVSILGTLSHFFYEWSGNNPLIGLFSPVSESTWEHMKLIFFPVLLWTLFLPPSLRNPYPFLRRKLLAGNLIGTFLIPILFYTYSGILGRTVTFIDILIFYTAAAAAFIYVLKSRKTGRICGSRSTVYILSALVSVLFFLFTFYPPSIGLFSAP